MTDPTPEPFYLSEEDGEVYEETTPGNCQYWNPQEVVQELNRLCDEVEQERCKYTASQAALTEFLTEHREYADEITRLREALEKIAMGDAPNSILFGGESALRLLRWSQETAHAALHKEEEGDG